MRIKAKNVTLEGLHVAPPPAEEPAGLGAVPNAAPATAPPYRVVPLPDGQQPLGGQPAVLVAGGSGARQPGSSGAQQPGKGAAQHPHQQAAQAEPSPPEPGSAPQQGRPQRKRRMPASAADMLPSDLLSRRSRPRAAGPPPHAGPLAGAPHLAHASMAALAAAAPAVAAGRAIQLVTVPAPGGGTMTGLAVPAAALLAVQQQLLRAHGAAAAAGLPGGAGRAPLLGARPPPAGPPPYRLLAPAAAEAGLAPVAAAREAAARDVAHLARQLDHEERRRALVAAEARLTARAAAAAAASQAAREAAGGRGARGVPAGGRGGRAVGEGAAGDRGRGRGRRDPHGRLSDPPEGRPHLPSGRWHPGFEAAGGVSVVHVADAAAAPTLPAAVVGTPPRLSQPLAAGPVELDLGDDPLRASLLFLRLAACTAGTPGAARAAAGPQARPCLERLARAHFARDGRRLEPEWGEGRRKTMRARAGSNPRMPPPPPQQRSAGGRAQRASRLPPRPEAATDVRRGAEFQAQLPAVRPRPTAPAPDEARWVAGLACRAGDAPAPAYDAAETAAMPAASTAERAAWVSRAHASLLATLGEARSAALGLLCMGTDACAGALGAGGDQALAAGMREHGRDFRAIAAALPGVSVFTLQTYWYNVWKLRGSAAAAAWYEERAAQAAARQAEAERAQSAAAAEQEAVRRRQEGRHKRRLLREVVQWLQGAARAPAEAQHRPLLVERAQRAAKLVGGLNAAAAAAPD